MKDLIERLRNATGPDRQLDEAIATAIGWTKKPWQAGACWLPPGGKTTTDRKTSLPKYTASIDAALTLVPKGWTSTIHVTINGGHAEIWANESRHIQDGASLVNAAIALCIAALRARESQS